MLSPSDHCNPSKFRSIACFNCKIIWVDQGILVTTDTACALCKILFDHLKRLQNSVENHFLDQGASQFYFFHLHQWNLKKKYRMCSYLTQSFSTTFKTLIHLTMIKIFHKWTHPIQSRDEVLGIQKLQHNDVSAKMIWKRCS